MKIYLPGLTLAVLAVAIVEWRTDEDLITLMVLAATSCGLGALRPRLFWFSGITLGSVVAMLNLLTALTGLRPIYESSVQARSHGVGYGLSLMVLTIPAFLAAWAGASLRWLIIGESAAA